LRLGRRVIRVFQESFVADFGINSPSQPLPDEQERLAALADLHVVDGGHEAVFDRIARIGQAALRFPLAHVTLITADRQILKTSGEMPNVVPDRSLAFCGLTIQGSDPLIIPDAQLDARVAHFPQVAGSPGIRAYWGMPLTTRHGYNVGAFCVLDFVTRHPGEADLSVLRDLARLTVECMEMRAQASTDVLTGVQSRRGLFSEGERLFARRSSANPGALSCVFIDIDRFKLVNDALGHAKGDQVLRDFAVLLHGALRAELPIGRVGGEEFIVLLPGESLAGAYAVAERLRGTIEQATLGGTHITASFGVAERLDTDVSLDDLVRRADQQLYEAKRAGRNTTRPDPNARA
jgi:diguanylate cyclase (GGDEF)-like protein